MRKVIDWLLLVSVLATAGYLGYTHQQQVHGIVHRVENAISPCGSPLTYSIGAIDPGFGISTTTLVADLKDAEGIWETASGKDLFQYEESGGEVTVNLVYDTRQAATDKLTGLGIQVDTSETSYDGLKSRYNTLSVQVTSEQSQYRAKVAAYKNDEAAYNARVQEANARGGASPTEYNQLQMQKAALGDEFASLQAFESSMNTDVDTVNALATAINQLIVQLNLNVAHYNQVGAAEGEFEEGLYQLANGVQTIDVYEYSNRVQLIRVLAHEMGHSLGLEHVADPNAIMYKTNSGTSLAATAADIAELNRACSTHSL